MRKPSPGAVPGTLVLASDEKPRIFVIDYCATHVIEKEVFEIDDVASYLADGTPSVTWVDVRGIGHQPTFERLGQIMKVLTILSTIFLPITFIAGVYGMNFDPASSPYNMPELKWRYGYLCTLAAMALSVLGLLVYYRRRGWLGGESGAEAARPERRAP